MSWIKWLILFSMAMYVGLINLLKHPWLEPAEQWFNSLPESERQWLFVVVVITVLLFIIYGIREFICAFFKINQIVKLLENLVQQRSDSESK